MRFGFSLVELSIVLVILGLLTGGILTGQSLIRAAELRAVTTEYQRYQSATQTFRDKYFALPGDMRNAESFWGTLSVADATCLTSSGPSALTCNGDGDGNIEASSTRSNELHRFWQHLANAGLVEGSYAGTRTGANHWDSQAGVNVPRSKLSPNIWSVLTRSDIAAMGGFYDDIFPPSSGNNWFTFGTSISNAGLAPEEAWNIDTKMDDGRPGSGGITTYNNTRHSNCADSDTAATAQYQLTLTDIACGMHMGF